MRRTRAPGRGAIELSTLPWNGWGRALRGPRRSSRQPQPFVNCRLGRSSERASNGHGGQYAVRGGRDIELRRIELESPTGAFVRERSETPHYHVTAVPVAPPDTEEGSAATEEWSDSRSEGGSAGRLARTLRALRIVVGVVLFALVVLAAVRSWEDVRATLARISPLELVLAEALVLGGLGASVLIWRVALRELGSTVHIAAAAKIYLVGQLGKFLPGSAWALAVQMELATQAGVPRVKSVAAGIVAIGVNVATGLAMGLFVVPRVVSGGALRMIVLAVMLAGCAVALSPPVLTRLVDIGLRVVRRPPVEREITWRGILTALGWSLASFACYGVSVWVLAVAVGAPAGESLPLCLAGVALAMTVGALVVVAPSGIGVREAVIVAALAPVLERPEALAVALVARLLFVLADLIAAAVVVPVRIGAPHAS